VVLEIIEALDVVFQLDGILELKGSNQMCYKFEELKGIDVLDDLQKHPNLKVYDAVQALINKFLNQPSEDTEINC